MSAFVSVLPLPVFPLPFDIIIVSFSLTKAINFCRHDRGQETFCGGNFSYNYGYRVPGKFRSMMSYGCSRGTCDIDSTSTCNRVQRFSGPDVNFNSKRAGDSKNNNARQITNVKAIAASFYAHKGGGGGGGDGGKSGSPDRKQTFGLALCITLVVGHFIFLG